MNIRMNVAMRSLLKDERDFPNALIRQVEGKYPLNVPGSFMEVDGIVRGVVEEDSGWEPDSDDDPEEIDEEDESDETVASDDEEDIDRTMIEATRSKTHMGDLFDASKISFGELVRIGIAYAFKLAGSLDRSPIQGPFQVGADGNSDSRPWPTSVVRFYRLRPDERPYLHEDLDYYENPVLTIDVKHGSSESAAES